MVKKVFKWIRNNYHKIISSIAFYPALTAIVFLIVSGLMLQFDYTETGKQIKSGLSWLTLKDANTARSIVSAIVGGLISLTVFSFSMVMIVLNQAASQMSNRVLEGMIGNRFQQFVLGAYIGSIVYALFLLTNIRDIHSGIYIPALSIYLLLLLTVADIFIFIYFLHYVTQSVKFETIIERVHNKTLTSLKRISGNQVAKTIQFPNTELQAIAAPHSGYYQGFDKKELTKFACEHDGVIHILYPEGSYLLQGIPIVNFYSFKKLSDDEIKKMLVTIDFYNGQPIEINPFYGFHQLAEVAIKALSPGINDPETAVLGLNAMTDLFSYKMHHFSPSVFHDEKETARVQITKRSFDELFTICYYPVWDYGKSDRYIQDALFQMMKQLRKCDRSGTHSILLDKFIDQIKEEIEKRKI